MAPFFTSVRFSGLCVGLCLLGALSTQAQTPDPSDTTYVRFNTTFGNIDVQLLTHEAPLNVANFMTYVNSGAYTNSVFHRDIPNFILQGGNFSFVNNSLTPIATNAPVQGEHGVNNTNAFSNVRGTLALALLDGPDTGTDSWFFNLVDNTSSNDHGGNDLDESAGGGPFTVFGVVANSSSLAVMDALSAVPQWNFGAPFDTLPLSNYSETQYDNYLNGTNQTVPLADFLYVNSITTLTTTNFNAWQAAFSSDPNAATDSAPAATPQNDHAPNLLKYFCGIPANASMSLAAQAKLPVAGKTTISGTVYQTLTYHQRPNMVGVFMTVQTSTDMQTWSPATSGSVTQTGTDSDGDSIMQVQVPAPTTGSQFLRLSLTQ